MHLNITLFIFVTLFLLSGCGLKTVPINNALSPIEAINDNYICKCKYNETKSHNGPNAYPKERLLKMAKKAGIYAIMSFNAYAGTIQIKIPQWDMVERFESSKGFGADVYKSADCSEIIIAFRGTDGFLAFNDHIFANLYINWFAGGQFSQADEVYKHVLYKYHPNKITTTGHSLGGGLALRLSILNKGVDAYVFDSSVRTSVGIGSENIWDNNIISIRDSGEMLSLFRFFPLFKEIDNAHGAYRFNFLGGSFFKEHGMRWFAYCMNNVGTSDDLEYEKECKQPENKTIPH